MNLGEKIKEYRKLLNLTQEQLAEKLEISKHTLSKYEQNQREPNIEMLNKISKALGVTINDLVSNEEKLKYELSTVEAIEILLNHKGYKISDFSEEEYQQIEKLVLEIIDLIAYKLSKS